jgi:hypothetical protein
MNTQYYKRVGTYYGYPECCIEFFIQNMFYVEKRNKAQKNIKASGETGFIPCTKHAKQILNKSITIQDILQNRKCETEFPYGRGSTLKKHEL